MKEMGSNKRYVRKSMDEEDVWMKKINEYGWKTLA